MRDEEIIENQLNQSVSGVGREDFLLKIVFAGMIIFILALLLVHAAAVL